MMQLGHKRKSGCAEGEIYPPLTSIAPDDEQHAVASDGKA
jgi:hypothetical protein